MTAPEIHTALQRYWPESEAWLYIKELRVATGYSAGAGQRIDAYVINCWPSNFTKRISVEIKVTKGDFKAELKWPLKREPAYRFSNELYFAAPLGLLDHATIPPDAGLLEVAPDGQVTVALPAPWHDGDNPSWVFVASLARTAAKRFA